MNLSLSPLRCPHLLGSVHTYTRSSIHDFSYVYSVRTKHAAVRSINTSVLCKKDSTSRPTLDDVERISKGNAAKARGTGSRRIPHRLNAEERQQYDIAKQKVQGMFAGQAVMEAPAAFFCWL